VTFHLDFKVTVIFMPIDVLSIFCAQLTRDLLAIAKFLLDVSFATYRPSYLGCRLQRCSCGDGVPIAV